MLSTLVNVKGDSTKWVNTLVNVQEIQLNADRFCFEEITLINVKGDSTKF